VSPVALLGHRLIGDIPSEVTDMPNAQPSRFLGTEYNDFLFARIGEDGNGMFLSVLSALARLDLDPWQEAADLARLPFDAAVGRFSKLITTLPDQFSVMRDSGAIATRVIALLPRSDAASPVGLVSTRTKLDSKLFWIGLAALTATILVAQILLMGRAPERSAVSHHLAPHSAPVTLEDPR
jgi:hypothetical protein